MGWWGLGVCCDISRLSPHLFQVLTTQTGFCYSEFVCPAEHPPVSSFLLETPCLAHISPMTSLTSYCLSAQCISNSVYPSWVSLHRKHYWKTRVAFRCRVDDGTSDNIFNFREVSWSGVLLFATLLLWREGVHVRWPDLLRILCGVCFRTFLKSRGLFLD